MGRYLSNLVSSISSFKGVNNSRIPQETHLFISDSISDPVTKDILLNELKNNTQYNVNPIQLNRLTLNYKQNGFVVPIDDLDNGNLESSFITTLNKYTGPSNIAYNTIQYFKDSKSGKLQQSYTMTPVKQSIFNPYFGVKAAGFSTNKPLLDVENTSTSNPWVDTADGSIWA